MPNPPGHCVIQSLGGGFDVRKRAGNTVIRRPPQQVKGKSKKVEPIKDKAAIRRILKLLEDKPRDLCLFVVGINTGYRASELVAIKVGQMRYLNAGDDFEVKQRKTGKMRRVTANQAVIDAVQGWLAVAELEDDDHLFPSQRGKHVSVVYIVWLVKEWCKAAGLRGNYGSHTLRKTWGYHQRMSGTALPLLMEAFGHSTQRQTLDYLCIQDEEIADLYQKDLYADPRPAKPKRRRLTAEEKAIIAAAAKILTEDG